MAQQTKQWWEEEFDRLFVYTDDIFNSLGLPGLPWRPTFGLPERELEALKFFISQKLQQQKERILEKLPEIEYDWNDDVKKAQDELVRDKKMFGEADEGNLNAMIENQSYAKGRNSTLSEIRTIIEQV